MILEFNTNYGGARGISSSINYNKNPLRLEFKLDSFGISFTHCYGTEQDSFTLMFESWSLSVYSKSPSSFRTILI